LPAQGVDPFTAVQVLAPMRKGSLGINELNQLLQAALNPAEPEKGELFLAGRLFRAGDRVIVTKNCQEHDVYNGDIGILRRIDEEAEVLVLDIDGELVAYPFEKANHLALAYVITIHKSQGSEYPTTVVLLFHQHYTMLQRRLLYTAMTRPKQRMIFIATESAIQRAVQNTETSSRNTLLAARIRIQARRQPAV
jgi:exodeoxyribonuclease V alpha subunit